MQRNINLLRELAKRHEVYYLTFNQTIHLPSQDKVDEGIEAVGQYCKHLKVFPVPSDDNPLLWYGLLAANLPFLVPYSTWRFYSRKMVRAIQDISVKENFDVTLIDTIALAQYSTYIPNIPVVLCHHNIESNLMFRKSAQQKNTLAKFYIYLQALKLRRAERRYTQDFAANTVVSDMEALELTRLYPKANVFTVDNGTDTEYFAPKRDLSTTPYSLIYIGGMTWYPNKDAMIHFCSSLFPRIKAQVPQATMTVIGKKPAKEVLAIAKNDPAISVLGFVDDIRENMAKAQIYVVPIRIGGGTRLKILDALAMGKAIVSTEVGTEGIDVEHNKDIVIAANDKDFIDQVVALLNDINRCQALEKASRETAVLKYSWQSIYPKLEKTLEFASSFR